MTVEKAYALGVQDGFDAWINNEPFGCGITWPDNQDLNEAYDSGVNVFSPITPEE